MIIYFTGTGNSRYAAKLMSAQLGDDAVDAGAYIKENRRAHLSSERPWVFVSPTYAWRLPRVFDGFIRDGSFEGNKNVYFVMTCGDDTGDAGTTIKKMCAETGLNYRGVLSVVMPENYVAMYGVPDVAESARIISAALPTLFSGVGCIRDERQFPDKRPSIADKLKSGAVNEAFYRFIVKAKDFYTTDACIGCGKCAELCPLGNISLDGGRPHWGNSCTHCMACICHCPMEAIEYGKQSKGKRRYLCPEYKP